jgi:guanylate kinase
MEEEIARGKFIEHAHVHTNIYGTSYEAVENVQSQGKICILDVDTQGVRSIKKSPMDCFYLFITPPSREDLEQRLRHRNSETEDKIQIRLKNSIEEIDFGTTPGNFDAIVTNKDVEVAFNEIAELLTKWYPEFEF